MSDRWASGRIRQVPGDKARDAIRPFSSVASGENICLPVCAALALTWEFDKSGAQPKTKLASRPPGRPPGLFDAATGEVCGREAAKRGEQQ